MLTSKIDWNPKAASLDTPISLVNIIWVSNCLVVAKLIKLEKSDNSLNASTIFLVVDSCVSNTVFESIKLWYTARAESLLILKFLAISVTRLSAPNIASPKNLITLYKAENAANIIVDFSIPLKAADIPAPKFLNIDLPAKADLFIACKAMSAFNKSPINGILFKPLVNLPNIPNLVSIFWIVCNCFWYCEVTSCDCSTNSSSSLAISSNCAPLNINPSNSWFFNVFNLLCKTAWVASTSLICCRIFLDVNKPWFNLISLSIKFSFCLLNLLTDRPTSVIILLNTRASVLVLDITSATSSNLDEIDLNPESIALTISLISWILRLALSPVLSAIINYFVINIKGIYFLDALVLYVGFDVGILGANFIFLIDSSTISSFLGE